MENPNPDKAAKVAEIATKLESAGAVLVTEYRGLNVPAQAQLRAAVAEAGGEYKIYKNTLTRIAAARTGVAIDEHLTGPTGLAFAFGRDGGRPDAVGLSKVLVDFAKANPNLVVRGGVVDGALVGAADVTTLAQLPPTRRDAGQVRRPARRADDSLRRSVAGHAAELRRPAQGPHRQRRSRFRRRRQTSRRGPCIGCAFRIR